MGDRHREGGREGGSIERCLVCSTKDKEIWRVSTYCCGRASPPPTVAQPLHWCNSRACTAGTTPTATTAYVSAVASQSTQVAQLAGPRARNAASLQPATSLLDV